MSELQSVRVWVSRATLLLLVVLTVSSVINIYDMAAATHTAEGWTAWVVSVGIAATLSVMVYVAAITDGRTRALTTAFAIVAVVISATLQGALFLTRGSAWPVALAFGVGVPLFEIFLALTDSMLRKYAATQSMQAPTQPTRAPVQRRNAPVQAMQPESMQTEPVQAPALIEPATDAPTDAPVVDAKAHALQLRDEGFTAAEIARITGAKYTTVQSWLRRASTQTNGVTQ